MAPKKGQKMSLGAFLDDPTLGSWADEMEDIPTFPALRTDEERVRDGGRSDFSSKPDRAPLPPREEVPLPTSPPYTAFVGNLAFDMSEAELGQFFNPHKTVSVKIITDRDGKPKGFGYVEFDELAGLKFALTKSGGTLSHRTIRVNVAEPPKERERGGFAGRDTLEDEKFSGNWRRDGPLPSFDTGPRRGSGFRSRDVGEDEGPKRGGKFQPSQENERPELNEDWRGSARGPLPPLERERDRRGGPNFESTNAADAEEVWTKGSKFRPNTSSETGSIGKKSGVGFDRGVTTPADEGDWRSRSRPAGKSREYDMLWLRLIKLTVFHLATSSTPPTPLRKKLELLPRSGAPSTVATPLASPSPVSSSNKSNPFGAAKPVDVSAREKEVEERLTREREEVSATTSTSFGRHPMSRESSRQASAREAHPLSRETSRQATTRGPQTQTIQGRKATPSTNTSSLVNTNPTVRPAFSFASAARRATGGPEQTGKDEQERTANTSSADEVKEDDENSEETPKSSEKVTEITA
ncbi:hypothetical protein Clacol_002882 [Clathrus columnatus]|uniref:RRM domain-containing protein n=1 Tax=Clathrus columnatus TaxID=1419009 RepID=A0AAV5A620_9AGAM|nr:hypothetical protein Clacol_002882 [Clathrus columnatus]